MESPAALRTDEPLAEWCVLVESRDGVVVVPLGGRPVRMGSSANDEVRIRADSVEPRHAVIELYEGEPVLTADRGRVYVNKSKATSRRVGHGDYVSLGEADLLIYSVKKGQALG